jgi:hypothetical protein
VIGLETVVKKILAPARGNVCKPVASLDLCRRLAPRRYKQYSLIAMLQAIAQAQIASLDKTTLKSFKEETVLDEDVWKEVTEHFDTGPWPHVEEDDWCGEWKICLEERP